MRNFQTIRQTIGRTILLAATACLSAGQCLAAPPGKDPLGLTPLQSKRLTALRNKLREDGKKARTELALHKQAMNNLLSEAEVDRSKVIAEQDKIESLDNAVERAKLAYRLEVADLLTPRQRALLKQLVEARNKHRAGRT